MKTNSILKILGLSLFLMSSCENEVSKKIAIHSETSEIDIIENSLAVRIHFDSLVNKHSIWDKMKMDNVPGVSIAIVTDGKIKWAKGYGIANSKTQAKVNSQTLFQAASITKPITALAVLKLYEEGKIDLDQDVNTYLKRWKIPVSEFTKEEKVTCRRLLTHSAGINVHGFPGYMTHLKLPELKAILNGEGNTSPVVVKEIPGQRFLYSGGGYTILEMLIEDVSGQDFETYMLNNILIPMGMNNSTYCQPIDTLKYANISAGFNSEGEMVPGQWHNYPELGAAGLWSTPTDIAKYCIRIQEIISGKENGILKRETVSLMLTPHENNWGLGPYLVRTEGSLLFGHYGDNLGYKNNFSACAYSGNAIIIMTNGDEATSLIFEFERSVSSFYGMGINDFKIVSPVAINSKSISKIIGRYICKEGTGIIAELKLINDTLFFINSDKNEKVQLTPVSDTYFVNLPTQYELTFKSNNGEIANEFIWQDGWEFQKIREE